MKILEFNGKYLLYRRINDTIWVALKPICEALSINYNRQYQNVINHPIYGSVYANQQMQVPGDQTREMICLPENYLYGWLFSINSSSPELLEYQKECNHILYNHFHGTITKRAEIYSALAASRSKMEELKTSLSSNDQFVELQELQMYSARLWKTLKGTTTDEQTLF